MPFIEAGGPAGGASSSGTAGLDALMQTMIDRSRDERHRVQLLHGCERLHYKRFDVEVLHMPGHTPGLICLHAAAQRLLFADDHVLAVRYLEGARAVHSLELDRVLPGHGCAFRNHRALLDGLFAFYQSRQAKLIAHLRNRPTGACALVEILFARRNDRRLHLMLSEVIRNLEVLEVRGEITRALIDGEYLFRAVAS